MSIEVFNSQLDSELLGGWMVTLELQPVAATGTLQFNSATLPAGAAYTMNGNSSGLFGSVTDSSVQASAYAPSSPFGVSVPASGTYLLDLNFKTPDNATGTFALVAMPGLFVTEWSNAAADELAFTNVPFGNASPVTLGYITIVPEPGTAMMLTVGICVLGGYALRQRTTRSRC